MATILVVDDRATNREVARIILDDAGHHVIQATEGRQGLELAQQLHPDVVITDVVMPGMDGYEFVHHLRADAGTADIPILLYTGNYRADEAQPLAAAYGVTKVLPKSADPEELLTAVEQALHDNPAAAAAPPAVTIEHLRTVTAKLVEKVLALDESEARFQALADLSPVGIVSGFADLLATYTNPRLSDILKTEPHHLLGHGWLHCLTTEHRRQLQHDGLPAAQTNFYGVITVRDGERLWLHTTVRRIPDEDTDRAGFVATIADVTTMVEAQQLRAAAERRRIAERFDGLARLSGAVAHDFNNMLNVILSFGEFTQDALRDATGSPLTPAVAAPMLRDLDNIHRAGQRAAHLAHQLLTFGGREIVKPTVFNANSIVEEVRAMIEATMGRQITVSDHLDPDLRNTEADADQLTQILLNLAFNARDAMPHGGHLTLRTDNLGHDIRPASLPTGDYIHIAVSDDGDGMTPEVLDRAVEPFFTTKPKGHGTGLGLATAYGIIRQAAGDLIIESSPGRGTTIHLYLPATENAIPSSAPEAEAQTRAGQTILVADDEDGVREAAFRILTTAGYSVLPAAHGREALAISRTHTGPIDAVLSDVVMPHMNGPELAEALRQERPDIPLLYMSGFAEPVMSEQGLLEPGVTVIGKPFATNGLLTAIEETLTRQTPDEQETPAHDRHPAPEPGIGASDETVQLDDG
jgi:PAS domain S-box-containing protein